VVAPSPGSGREWIHPPTGPWAPAPEWLKRENEARIARENAYGSPRITGFEADIFSALGANGRYCGDTPKGIAALKGACQDIVNAKRGTRDDTLNTKFYKIARLIDEGELGPHAAQAVLKAGLAMLDPLPTKAVLEKARRVLARGISDSGRSREGGFGSRSTIDGSGTSYRGGPWRETETDRFSFGWLR
jgi:hypothetical protein